MLKLMLPLALAFCLVPAAFADWNPGDPHKMHYPQLPDPSGWDVDITTDYVFDDWMCTGSGPVTDIHFWGSWRGDIVGQLDRIIVEVWSDVPAGDPTNELPYSHPGVMLWAHTFAAGDWTMREPETGLQGWFSPEEPSVLPQDHNLYYQVNFQNIMEPFVQKEGEIYWLGIHAIPAGVGPMFGWKTSVEHWNDDATFYFGGNWRELRDPLMPDVSLDMAFVITPEPTTLLAAGLLGVMLLRRR